jgi:hypothetical protein
MLIARSRWVVWMAILDDMMGTMAMARRAMERMRSAMMVSARAKPQEALT